VYGCEGVFGAPGLFVSHRVSNTGEWGIAAGFSDLQDEELELNVDSQGAFQTGCMVAR
jgi:hypothetical protein